mmetsp:Transcript_59867/g.105264  ORF Transcript_59867/g.105264 Transcript_59867/m.105264 type:complete len:262 (-) Transcript_59867:365-1150(-)
MHPTGLVVLLQGLVGIVHDRTLGGVDGHGTVVAEDDVLGVVHDGVLVHHLGRAERFLDLALHILRRVFHEDGRVRVGLGHFLLAFLQARQHVVGDNDRFKFLLLRAGVLSCEHVDLSLVHAQLADVRLEEEHIGALHARVENLRGTHFLGILAPHDGAAALDAGEVVHTGHVHHQTPVLFGVRVDLVGGPQKAYVLHVHANGLPDFNHVLADHADLLEISVHLVVQLGEPIRHPELEQTAGGGELVHVDGTEHTLGDVHAS